MLVRSGLWGLGRLESLPLSSTPGPSCHCFRWPPFSRARVVSFSWGSRSFGSRGWHGVSDTLFCGEDAKRLKVIILIRHCPCMACSAAPGSSSQTPDNLVWNTESLKRYASKKISCGAVKEAVGRAIRRCSAVQLHVYRVTWPIVLPARVAALPHAMGCECPCCVSPFWRPVMLGQTLRPNLHQLGTVMWP